MTTLFLDTNIVIDLLEKREPFCYDAVRLFTMAYDMSKHDAENVRNLLSSLRLLTQVTTANESTVDDALASQFKDFEDALQYYSALQTKAEAIITRNSRDFTNSKLPVMTAGEYLDMTPTNL